MLHQATIGPSRLRSLPAKSLSSLLHVIQKKDCRTEAAALLMYTRFLDTNKMTYRSISKEPAEGGPWLFADFLLDNLTEVDPVTREVLNQGVLSLSTARSYIAVVIDFYKWLHREAILPMTEDQRPFHFKLVRVPLNTNADAYLLSHTRKNVALEVQTTTLMQRFPKVQHKDPMRKLAPLSRSHKAAFERVLHNEQGADIQCKTKELMLLVALKTGMRVAELVSFPESIVRQALPGENKITCTIGPVNGCLTKNGKQREISLPTGLMSQLLVYKYSSERMKMLKKSEESHGRLFISNRGQPFSTNTMATYLAGLREQLRAQDETFYCKLHDLRATFATYWLLEQAQQRQVAYDYLISELAELMGHSSTATTQKYIDFMNTLDVLIRHSAVKNAISKEVLS